VLVGGVVWGCSWTPGGEGGPGAGGGGGGLLHHGDKITNSLLFTH